MRPMTTQQLAATLNTLYRKLYPQDGSLPQDPVLLSARQDPDQFNRLLFGLLGQIGAALARQEQALVMALAHVQQVSAQPAAPQTQAEALQEQVDMDSPLPATQATVTSVMPAAVPAAVIGQAAPVAVNGGMVSVSAPTPAITPAAQVAQS